VKLSPDRFSCASASYTAFCTAMFREGIHMHAHMRYLRSPSEPNGSRTRAGPVVAVRQGAGGEGLNPTVVT